MQQPFGQQLVAGDTWKWTITVDDFPADQFTLKYFFRGPSSLDIVATASGSDFVVDEAPTDTAALAAGQYLWQMCAFDASNNRTELDRGTVEILADISQIDGKTATEGRSWVKQARDQVRDSILNYSGRIDQEYQIAGRMLRIKSLADLLTLEGTLTWRYKRELIESGQLPPSTHEVRASFGDPSDPILERMWRNFPGSSA